MNTFFQNFDAFLFFSLDDHPNLDTDERCCFCGWKKKISISQDLFILDPWWYVSKRWTPQMDHMRKGQYDKLLTAHTKPKGKGCCGWLEDWWQF